MTMPRTRRRTMHVAPSVADVRNAHGWLYARCVRLMRDHASEINGDGESLLTRAAFTFYVDALGISDLYRWRFDAGALTLTPMEATA